MFFRFVFSLLALSLFYTTVRSEAKLEESGQTVHLQDVSSGSGENIAITRDHQPKGKIPKTDHSKGVYMHDHPDFPALQGEPGDPYRTHYLHARFGIGGHRRRRSLKLEEAMLKIFKIRLPKEENES